MNKTCSSSRKSRRQQKVSTSKNKRINKYRKQVDRGRPRAKGGGGAGCWVFSYVNRQITTGECHWQNQKGSGRYYILDGGIIISAVKTSDAAYVRTATRPSLSALSNGMNELRESSLASDLTYTSASIIQLQLQ